jgi:hypothetical protein
MIRKNFICGLVVLVPVSLALSWQASAYTTTTFTGATADASAIALFPTDGPLQTAEGRIGDNTVGGATFELDWHRYSNSAVNSTGQFAYTSGTAYNFSVTYDPAQGTLANKLTYVFNTGGSPVTLNPTYLTSTEAANLTLANSLWLRVYAGGTSGGTTSSAATLSNLSLTPTGNSAISLITVTASGSGASPATTDTIFQGLSLSSGFVLTGTANFSWSGTIPSNSNLDFNVKVASTAVPEPSTYAAIGAVALAVGGTWLRRRG